MKSPSRCHFLLLVFLFVRAVVLVKASNKPISCGNDANCQALVKLMEKINEINNKLEEPSSCPDVQVKLDKLAATVDEKFDKQANDAEELNVKLVAISTQLEKHSADLLQHDERLKTNDVCPDMNEKLDKQAKDLDELKVNLNRSLASTSIISTQLEKHSADLLQHDERLKANDICPDVNDKFDKLLIKQVKDVDELKAKLDRSLTSTAAISTQLEKHSADLLQHDERLKANDVCPDVNENLEKLAATVHEKLDRQVKDVEELKVKLDRNSAELLQLDERLKSNDVCPDVNENLEKLATNVRDMHSKQVKDAEELKVNMNRSLTSTVAISVQLEKHSADLLRHDERLKAHDVSQNNIYELVKSIHSPPKPKDCTEIRDSGYSVSGVYRVDLGNENRKIEIDVYCDFKSVGQSWLVFQRRKDGSVSFDRNWNDYANGFGDLTGEFWLGNEKLSLLTMNKKYKLRIELEDFAGAKVWAEFSTFSVKPSTDKYRLTVAGYSGNAGDSFTSHNNMMFSTKDADNDAGYRNCAQEYTGGWWFRHCMSCNLNGLYLGSTHTQYGRGIYWYPWRGGHNSLKVSEMKIAAV